MPKNQIIYIFRKNMFSYNILYDQTIKLKKYNIIKIMKFLNLNYIYKILIYRLKKINFIKFICIINI